MHTEVILCYFSTYIFIPNGRQEIFHSGKKWANYTWMRVGDGNCIGKTLKSYEAYLAVPEGKADLMLWNDPRKGQKVQSSIRNGAEVEEHKFVVPSLAWLCGFSLIVRHFCVYRENSDCRLDPHLGLAGGCVWMKDR